jgi:hypothetical protein
MRIGQFGNVELREQIRPQSPEPRIHPEQVPKIGHLTTVRLSALTEFGSGDDLVALGVGVSGGVWCGL